MGRANMPLLGVRDAAWVTLCCRKRLLHSLSVSRIAEGWLPCLLTAAPLTRRSWLLSRFPKLCLTMLPLTTNAGAHAMGRLGATALGEGGGGGGGGACGVGDREYLTPSTVK